MEPMKPDAVNVGSPKYELGDLINWTHDMFLNQYPFVKGIGVIVENHTTFRNQAEYKVHMFITGTVITCYDRNLEHYKP